MTQFCLSRRFFVLASPLGLAACASPGLLRAPVAVAPEVPPHLATMYGTLEDGGQVIEALDVAEIPRRLLRQQVAFAGRYQPGTIVVDPGKRYLYLVEEGGRAMRYGVGVGKEGFDFRGDAIIGRKAMWPYWTPTRDMIAREPERYGPHSRGLPGGIENPLGARALYLYRNGADTLYRIHGTNEPDTIGTKVSSGCIRMFNHDVIDLYQRVPSGAPVTVLPASEMVASAGTPRPSRSVDRPPAMIRKEEELPYEVW